MEEKSFPFNIPIWAWGVGCLVLVFACAMVIFGSSLLIYLIPVRSQTTIADTSTTVPDTFQDPDNQASSPTIPTLRAPIPLVTDPAENQDQPIETPSPDSKPATPEVSDPFAADRAQIEANVVQIRELQAKEQVKPTVLTDSELRQRLEEDLAEDYSLEEARFDAIALSMFDFFPPDFDLYNFTIDLFTEQIAGFYDPENDEFVIVSDDGDFDALDRWTHAHEFVHALQDQYFDLDLLEDDSISADASLAIRALAEGDATLVQTQYLLEGYFNQGEVIEILNGSLDFETRVLDSAPPVLVHELEFPYLSGLNFVETLYDQGQIDAVNKAWQNLPQSSEQILHPERYLSGDSPQIVTLAPLTDTLGVGWQQIDEDTLGEFYIKEYLSQQLEREQVEEAATGWGGDRYAAYWNQDDQNVVMTMKLVWDRPTDADEFSDAYVNYVSRLFATQAETLADGGQCWRGDDVICFYHINDVSLIARAPDMTTANAVATEQLNTLE
jgi:hypothetical protein